MAKLGYREDLRIVFFRLSIFLFHLESSDKTDPVKEQELRRHQMIRAWPRLVLACFENFYLGTIEIVLLCSHVHSRKSSVNSERF